ncbi:class I SAM-dependent methyltransferase [Microvirga sp. BT689]|uniref:class I SAM-dependent methyltransferase n=1 Tax=Microvirga arvi TaxID=2778731 RepID=UPI00194F4D1D|nr:class I SAM-dependent methyltransferase [Microvirga arvi]MBM6578954.1 class I SAM-dependent methyltransferase [Microvirga arvi]
MGEQNRHDAWNAGDSYDRYMGRWSRLIAPRFLAWLAAPGDSEWLEVGCGTGALSKAILDGCAPRRLTAIEPSEGFLAQARRNVPDPRVEFRRGDAQDLPVETDSQDVVVSGLVLNFVPDRLKALSEMKRVARRDATIAFYVWDYPGGGIQFMRAFWSAATTLDPSASDLTEDKRFPFCTRERLTELAREAELASVEATALEVPTVFTSFEDYWQPFTLGAGPAPGYCTSLDPEARQRLRQQLEATLPREPDGSIHLRARAWAVKALAS